MNGEKTMDKTEKNEEVRPGDKDREEEEKGRDCRRMDGGKSWNIAGRMTGKFVMNIVSIWTASVTFLYYILDDEVSAMMTFISQMTRSLKWQNDISMNA